MKAIVVAGHGVAWCGVGTEIVILQVDTLKEVTRFDAQPDKVKRNRMFPSLDGYECVHTGGIVQEGYPAVWISPKMLGLAVRIRVRVRG